MLNPCHEVNKLLHYGNKHQGSSIKENVFYLETQVIPFKAHQESIKNIA